LAYIFRNAGKTPAILEEVMHSMMLEKTERHTINYDTPDRALEIIPGESDLTDRIAVTFDGKPFLVEDAMALGDHDLMLFFYSAATYRDIYNRKHKIRHDFLYSAGRFHLINRIEKTIDAEEHGGAESEQTSRIGFFPRSS
jgi:MinD-like ATPase involved in chromosome partitioning or flagellar assembly